MTLRRVAQFTVFLLLGLGWSLAAQAQGPNNPLQGKNYPLVAGSGGQLHIGNGLALPIQAAAMAPIGAGTVFPPLLIKPVDGAYVHVTTAMTSQQKISIQTGQLSKPAGQTTVGVKTSNPVVYAVGTNLQYVWPNAAAVLSTGAARPGGPVATFVPGPAGQSVIYNSTALASKFGGAAQFALSSGGSTGIIPLSPVTVYLALFGGPVPCHHTAITGPGTPDPLCKARLAPAYATGLAAAGGPVSVSVNTVGTKTTNTAMTMSLPGIPVTPGVAALSVGTNPSGTILAKTLLTASGPGIGNTATSAGYPWTVGKLSLIALSAMGAPEIFVITGRDDRTKFGGGSIQLVSGALSLRPLSGDNANRGWVRLVLGTDSAPMMSPLAQGAMAGLILLGGGYALRRKFASA